MRYRRLLFAGIALSLGSIGWGCLSTQTQTSLDGTTTGANGSGAQPFVEAYIEYPGPQEVWSGPGSFLVHVQAREAGPAQITLTPALRSPDGDANSARQPAGSAASVAASPAAHRMSSEEARTQIAHLVTALQGAQAPFSGCMYPVRVRLVRADGGLFERQGCRSPLGWSRAVSEAASSFIAASGS